MADASYIKTSRITRDKLAAVFRHPEIVKLIENLTEDVRVSIPQAVASSGDVSDDLGAGAQALASAAHALASMALDMAAQAGEGPPPVPAQAAEMADESMAQISALRDRVATLERTVAELLEGPT